MKENVINKLSRVSTGPGVYIMKDTDGRVIYVGKAGNLRKRLSSYFSRNDRKDAKTGALIKKITAFDTIITGTEKEAFILESNLIKRYRPRYNVILKDDKRYPSLRLDVNSPYPNLTIVRKIKKDDCLYFGPYSSAHAVRETLKVINKTFKLRKCKTREPQRRDRPCLNYQMNTCLSPCCLRVNPSDYHEIVNEVVLFLKGKTPDLIRKMKSEMVAVAEIRDYEKAAELRDRVFALEKTLEKQVVVVSDLKDRDVFAVAATSPYSTIMMLTVRNGYLRGSRNFNFNETMATKAELMESFIKQYYEKLHFIPQEILVSVPLESTSMLEDFLRNIKEQKVSIRCPQRGEKNRLVKMAIQNAKTSLDDWIASNMTEQDLLKRLQKRLNLKKFPRRIECFDNSNLSGKIPVAGMVTFENAKPEKSSYRKFNIKSVTEPDDYACMSEVLNRRFEKGEGSAPFPDLLMVDGGKGQLNISASVIKDLNLNAAFDIIAIAKKDERRGETRDKIYQPGRSNPINFGKDQDLLLFLQRIRDESHRFAISFHRRKRTIASMRSFLDTIPGIAGKRKETLLKHFGGIQKIRAASLKELSELPGMNTKVAESVLRTFKDAQE